MGEVPPLIKPLGPIGDVNLDAPRASARAVLYPVLDSILERAGRVAVDVLDDLGAFPRAAVLESVLGTMIASIKHLIFSESGAVNHAMIHHGMII